MAETKTLINQPERDHAQDIAKGIGILLVMQVHIFSYPMWYQIIMAITGVWLMSFYFTLSGYYYKPGKRTPKESIKRRVSQLVKPFFMYSIGIWILTTAYNLITHSYTLLECVKQYLRFFFSRNALILVGLAEKGRVMSATPQAGVDFSRVVGPFWFLVMMFMADIIFFLIADFALKNNKNFLSITTGLILISFLLNVLVDKIEFGLPWNFQNVPMATALILIGAMLGKHKVLSKGFTTTKWMIINSLVTVVIILILEWQYRGIGSFSGGSFIYFGAVETFPCVLFGIMAPFMAVSFSRFVEKIPVVSNAMIWVGYRTLPFLLVHMFISKFVGIFTGITPRNMATPGADVGKTFLNLLITIAIIVVYRIVWELILKMMKEKKKTK